MERTEKQTPDWSELSYRLVETDFIYRATGDRSRARVWRRGGFLPYGEVAYSPAAAFLSYGLGIFEGLKARRTADRRILLFRPERNAERFRRSAEQLLMAPFPRRRFIDAVEELVRRNARFVPPFGRGSLYVRPTEHAIEPKLGIGPCNEFQVMMYCSPVGSYFSGPSREGLRLRVLEQGRVAAGGTGSAKAMGNYANCLAASQAWKKKGFDEVLYLDARHLRYVTETSGSNFFMKRKDGVVVTPPLDDQILPGVTRESVIAIARDLLCAKVEERPLPIEEVLAEGKEVFCTGTAWTIQNVNEIFFRDRGFSYPDRELRSSLLTILQGIQRGARDDPFGWTRPVATG